MNSISSDQTLVWCFYTN